MRTTQTALVTALILTSALAAGGGDFVVPLDLRPDGGTGGMRVVTNGVPLLQGQADDVKSLAVIGPDGKPVPAQFRPLARWWRGDNSLRWVLVSFVRNDSDGGVYGLIGRKNAPAAPGRAQSGMRRSTSAS